MYPFTRGHTCCFICIRYSFLAFALVSGLKLLSRYHIHTEHFPAKRLSLIPIQLDTYSPQRHSVNNSFSAYLPPCAFDTIPFLIRTSQHQKYTTNESSTTSLQKLNAFAFDQLLWNKRRTAINYENPWCFPIEKERIHIFHVKSFRGIIFRFTDLLSSKFIFPYLSIHQTEQEHEKQQQQQQSLFVALSSYIPFFFFFIHVSKPVFYLLSLAVCVLSLSLSHSLTVCVS